MERKLIVLVGFALFLGACGLPLGLPKEYRYAGQLSRADLVGLWVMDAKSVDLLDQAGARLYRRQTDHVFLLNDDASCVLRGFGISLPPFPVFGQSEEIAYTQPFSGSSHATLPNPYRKWYQWNTNGLPVISGPIPTPVTAPGIVSLPSQYTIWYFDDWGPRVSRPPEESIRTRYGVCLSLYQGGPGREWSMDLYVGQDAQGLFLWMMGPLPPLDVPRNTLVYRRSTMEELLKMVQSGK